MREASATLGGGFYGRGFETLFAASDSFACVKERDCVRFVLGADSSAASNFIEAYLFSERLSELRDKQA